MKKLLLILLVPVTVSAQAPSEATYEESYYKYMLERARQEEQDRLYRELERNFYLQSVETQRIIEYPAVPRPVPYPEFFRNPFYPEDI